MVKVLSFLLILFLFSCAGVPNTPAPWDVSPAAIRQIYPDSEYIAQRGIGKSREAAEADGAAQIARYFNTQISSSIQIKEQDIRQDGNTYSNIGIETETFVQSQMNLFGIRYARDAYYNKQLKEWVTVAYINRKEAWEIFEPRLVSVTSSFIKAYDAAGAAEDPLSRYSQFRTVMRIANETGGTTDLLAYAQILYPEKAREFSSAQNRLSGISAELQAVLDRIIISINCNNDFENIIASAIIEALRQGGFKTTAGAASGTNKLEVMINEGRQNLEAGVFFTPNLTLTLYSEGKIIFTWTADAPRQGAWDASVAKRESWNSLALKIKESLLADFLTAIEGGNK